MHQIRKDNQIPPFILQKHLKIQNPNWSTPQNTSNTPTQSHNHLKIQIPSSTPNHSLFQGEPFCNTPSTTKTHQINFQGEPICNTQSTSKTHKIIIQGEPICNTPSRSKTHKINFQGEPICSTPSTSKTHISTPHKRPKMSPNLSLSHSPTLSSLHHHRNMFKSQSWQPFLLCFSSIEALFATKTILRLALLLFLPSLFFFRFFFLPFLTLITFAIFLAISLNIAAPRIPSIKLLLSRSFATKIPSSNTRPQVVWSIGSKPKSEKRPNSGSWVQVYGNGDVYEGEFYKGKCSGSGVYYYYMSGRYEGDWVDEKYDGHGVETWAKGSRYRGQYRQGLRHGFGVYRFFTGDVYTGEWCNGQCQGCGVHTCEDGSQYVGEFKWGIKHGLGHYHFRNGDTYAGEYFADKMHGFGVYRFGSGHRYEGAWHEGRRQGLGMYTFRNGDTQLGHWQNGVLNVTTTQNPLPGSPSSVNHSKVLYAVQEAQRAAEKAAGVVKVNERVNRAVAAANKAATAARVAAVKAVQNQMHQNNNSGDDLSV